MHRAKKPVAYKHGEGWSYKIEYRDVLFMAMAGKWAMVRRPGAMPYVCPVNELHTKAELDRLASLVTNVQPNKVISKP